MKEVQVLRDNELVFSGDNIVSISTAPGVAFELADGWMYFFWHNLEVRMRDIDDEIA